MYNDENPYHALDAEIIIIGGGISGLATAYDLLMKEPTLHVTILEATDQIGGRSLSDPRISPQHAPLLQLLNKLQIKFDTRSGRDRILVASSGQLYNQSKRNPFGFCSVGAKFELAGFIARIERLCGENLDPDLSSQTMETFIHRNLKHETNRMILRWTILMHCGASAAEITLGFYVFFCISTHGVTNQLAFDAFWALQIQRGAQEICAKIARDVTVLRNTKVREIKMTRNDVAIKTHAGATFFSEYVVLAIPPSEVLKIKFKPPLPDSKLKILKSCVPGILTKFVATYSEAFWKDEPFDTVYDLNCQCVLYCHASNGRVLSGYVVGGDRNLILQQLGQYFGGEALQPLNIAFETCTGSPMSCYRCLEDVREIQRRTERIFWGGAEASLEWFGCVCGAVNSANRVAREVLYDIRPASLTIDDMVILKRNSLSSMRKRLRPHSSIHKKLASPYYQTSALLMLVLLTLVCRKYRLHSRLMKTFFY